MDSVDRMDNGRHSDRADTNTKQEGPETMISAAGRHVLLVADRTRDPAVVAAMVESVMAENPAVTLIDIETAFRDGAAQSYIIAGDPFEIVIGMPAWRAALDELGIEPEDNRETLRLTRK